MGQLVRLVALRRGPGPADGRVEAGPGLPADGRVEAGGGLGGPDAHGRGRDREHRRRPRRQGLITCLQSSTLYPHLSCFIIFTTTNEIS